MVSPHHLSRSELHNLQSVLSAQIYPHHICAWLDGLQSPSATTLEFIRTSENKPSPLYSSPLKRKRDPLAEVSAIRMNQNGVSDSPSKSQKPHTEDPSHDGAIFVDNNATPTANSLGLLPTNAQDPRPPQFVLIQKTVERTSIESGSTQNSSRAASGRTSPKKSERMLDLRRLPQPIITDSFQSRDFPPPPSLMAMKRRIAMNTTRMSGLVPESRAKNIQAYLDAQKLGALSDDDEGLLVPDTERDKLGPTPPIESVGDIFWYAKQCEAEEHHKCSWNCAVHFPLLKCALDNKRFREKVLFYNWYVFASAYTQRQSNSVGALLPGSSRRNSFPNTSTKKKSPRRW